MAEKAEELKEKESFTVETKHLRCFINYRRLERKIGKERALNVEAVGEMLNKYRESLTYQGVLKKGEHRVGDDLLLLVVEELDS